MATHDITPEQIIAGNESFPPPVLSNSMKIPKWMEGWSGLLERIHRPLPLSEDLIAHDPT
jgi:hypothetical protein